ncbi:hypothetical protein HanIR_Chr07g0338831 [Helianthus annuus]|nr:hypothetical protein HanIR_Chr07g0338831 [Helianthus annuus]
MSVVAGRITPITTTITPIPRPLVVVVPLSRWKTLVSDLRGCGAAVVVEVARRWDEGFGYRGEILYLLMIQKKEVVALNVERWVI